uniref:Uncharacterized protein n=1 Tax=Opuntia streptacantha TaxID=393608 RepID=A0A7C9DAT9_OPUST
MASLNPLKTLSFLILFSIITSASANDYNNVNIALQPVPSLLSPLHAPGPAFGALSPDITPLFPTPLSGAAPLPSQSSMPVIPSSPSPPAPDSLNPPPPEVSISPTRSMSESSTCAPHLSASLNLAMLAMIYIAFW